jgi:spore germination cell wall hydrolase CwlJ-like protein
MNRRRRVWPLTPLGDAVLWALIAAALIALGAYFRRDEEAARAAVAARAEAEAEAAAERRKNSAEIDALLREVRANPAPRLPAAEPTPVSRPAIAPDEQNAGGEYSDIPPDVKPATGENTASDAMASEIEAIALTLAGECYDDQPEDKLRVAWVIASRMDSPDYPDTALGVVSDTRWGIQFAGYWKQHRDVTDDDRDIARAVLEARAAGDYRTRETAPDGSVYLGFSAGNPSDKVNEFR